MSMEAKRNDLAKLYKELEAGQEKMRGGELSQAEGEALDAKAKEAIRLRDEIEAYEAREAMLKDTKGWLDRPAKPAALPADHQPTPEAKTDKVVGYMTPGAYVEAQKSVDDYFREFGDTGVPRGSQFKLADIEGVSLLRDRRGGQVLVPLTKTQVQNLRETKAVPSLGSEVIEPTRVADVIRVNEFDRLRLRDVLDISSTQSSAVRYVRVNGFTQAAAATAHGDQKPEGAITMDVVTETVETIAVWYPVHNQQLDDYGQLRNIIDNHLMYDVDKAVENLILYGSGASNEWTGIVTDTGVLAARTGVTPEDTTLDLIRGMITDVAVSNYEANAVVIHPYDWEDVVLTKGTDDHFVWAMVQNAQAPRIWGVPVVETNSAYDAATGDRNIIVGDFRRGATLWDRMQTTVMVGWQDDQFIRNMRTILAEMRAAFGVTRPAAFRKLQTLDNGS